MSSLSVQQLIPRESCSQNNAAGSPCNKQLACHNESQLSISLGPAVAAGDTLVVWRTLHIQIKHVYGYEPH
jgi:hypothetical protein